MEFSQRSIHLCLLQVLLIDVIDVASSTAKVESEIAPGLLLFRQHLGYVVCIVSIGERASHRQGSLVNVGVDAKLKGA